MNREPSPDRLAFQIARTTISPDEDQSVRGPVDGRSWL
jgi:hypothetical protein